MVGAILSEIESLQSTGGMFESGLFPARRHHLLAKRGVPDDSIFPTVVTLHALQRIKDDLPEAMRSRVEYISNAAAELYDAYLNNQGILLYNFWRNASPERFFPNNRWFSRLRIFHLPEDIDTTAYVYMVRPHLTEEVVWLHDFLAKDSRKLDKAVRKAFAPYDQVKPYSTWAAAEKVPVDYDVCALSNLVLLFLGHDLNMNDRDRDSIAFIVWVIKNDLHFSHSFEVAPWYADTTLILYHVTRLVASFSFPGAAELRPKLIHDLLLQAAREERPIERVLLSSSLLRLGQRSLRLPGTTVLREASGNFRFFRGSSFTMMDNPAARALAKRPLFQLGYTCRALALSLVLEHEVLLRSRA